MNFTRQKKPETEHPSPRCDTSTQIKIYAVCYWCNPNLKKNPTKTTTTSISFNEKALCEQEYRWRRDVSPTGWIVRHQLAITMNTEKKVMWMLNICNDSCWNERKKNILAGCVGKMAEWINAEWALYLKRQLQDDRWCCSVLLDRCDWQMWTAEIKWQSLIMRQQIRTLWACASGVNDMMLCVINCDQCMQ